MFTAKQIKSIKELGFVKINDSAYQYQNAIIFVIEDVFSLTVAQANKFINEDFNTFEKALKFIQQFKFCLFTKKQLEYLQELNFKKIDDSIYENNYENDLLCRKTVLFSYENYFAIEYFQNGLKCRECFYTFAETADFLKII